MRKDEIEDSRQEAWGAACNADFIGIQHDKLTKEDGRARGSERSVR
jgi:hypothetical protein